MTTTTRPNRDALSKAVDIYRDAMRPFVIRTLRRMPSVTVEEAITQSLPYQQAENFRNAVGAGADLESALDANYFPNLVSNRYNWRDAFSLVFNGDKTVQSKLWLITDARNQVAHPGAQDLEDEYTRTHLYHISEVLGRINAPDLKKAVEDIRDQWARAGSTSSSTGSTQSSMGTDQQADQEPAGRQQSRANGNLKPWREVIKPNQDVAQGSYQQAEFMADLQQVYMGRADHTQYGNPVSFFEHTYITPGIRALLLNALKRLNGSGGDPVIQTKTGFGGGKTHSLIALYHLVRHADALVNPQPGLSSSASEEIRSIMAEAGYDQNPYGLGEVAVLDGNFLATTDYGKTDNGDLLNNLWGVMAYQLGKQPGYDIIGEAVRQGLSPGGAQLDALLEYVGPCVILIDEPVAYIRNAGAAQDNIYTFIQSLTQSIRRSRDAVLVITLPQSRVEAGGESGAEALDRLDSILARVEAVWEPLAISETFEVVRRRLFGSITDQEAADRTCEAFSRMYSNGRREYPQGVAEQNYLQRLRSCYPIHPEIFERLYSDWSSIPEFQRTRGVLRMLSICVHRLYLNNDPNYLIMPADLPLSDEALANEFIRLLPGNWRPVVSEADSDNSRTDNIDKESQRYADLGGAARRVARTIFLGSADSGATKGIDQRSVHLGAVQPGQGVSTYNEALNRMVGDLYYLYNNDVRYFFHAEENLNKVASDRAEALSDQTVDDHIIRILEEVKNRRGDVILYSGNTAEVDDTDSVRLVVLPPGLSLPTRSQETDTAGPEALKLLQWRGDGPRTRRNTLIFLTAKRDEVRYLRNEVRRHLAWDSIINGVTQIQGLAGDRLSQATVNSRDSSTSVRSALVRAYRWALAPVQSDPKRAEYALNQTQIEAGQTGEIIARTFEKLVQEEALVTTIIPAALTSMFQQYIWNREDSPDHLGIDALWDLLTNNVYLHRLKDKAVLVKCIEQGVEQGSFGYATDHLDGKYEDLRYAESMTGTNSVIAERNVGFLVRPDAAARQKEADWPAPPPDDDSDGGQTNGTGTTEPQPLPPDPVPAPTVRGPRHITARKTSGANVSLDDFNALREEIIRNLSADGGEITVEITVSARKPDGFSESITRSVRENSLQLGLDFTTSDDD